MAELKMFEVEKYKINTDKAIALSNAYGPFLDEARAMEVSALKLVITSEDQVDEMKRARKIRLQIKKVRTETEKKRKELKAGINREGKAIDGMANIIKFIIEPIEIHLQKQEDFVKNIIAAKAAEKLQARIAELLPLMLTPPFTT